MPERMGWVCAVVLWLGSQAIAQDWTRPNAAPDHLFDLPALPETESMSQSQWTARHHSAPGANTTIPARETYGSSALMTGYVPNGQGPACTDGLGYGVWQAETCGPADYWSPAESFETFIGLEGSKQPQDFGVNAHFGGRAHANWAFPVVEGWGLGIQLGTAINATDHAVRVTSKIDGSSSRTQSFTTVGLFQRSPGGWTWGLVHDVLYQEDYDEFTLSQWRGRVGYAVTRFNEVGVQAMLPQRSDRGNWGPIPIRLGSITQGSLYWRHTWEQGAETGFWLGAAKEHGQANVALGDDVRTGSRVVFGSDLHIPLNSWVALFGEANFITPADSGTVDAYLGLAFYPGRNARGWRKQRFSPALPVANNTSMSIDLSRQ